MKNKLESLYENILKEQMEFARAAKSKPIQATRITPKEDSNEMLKKAQPAISALNKEAPIPVNDPDVGDESDEDELSLGNMAPILRFKDTNLPQYNYKSFILKLNVAYDTKQPLLVYGDPGIGKSAGVANFADSLARERGKKLIKWHDLDEAQKRALIENPEGSFVLMVVTTAELEPTDFVGIPDVASGKEYLETKRPVWTYFITRPGADGILFFDELNLGSGQTLNALYKTTDDYRMIGGVKMSEDFAIVAAGNLGSEFTGTNPLPPPLVSRFTCGGLVLSAEEWLEYAEKEKIDSRIIAFVKSNPDKNFYSKPPANESDAYPTPRSFVKLSKQIRSLRATYKKYKLAGISPDKSLGEELGDAAAGTCGTEWAQSFMTFLRYIELFYMKQILRNVNNLPKEQVDRLHALVVFVTSKVKSIVSKMANKIELNPDELEILEGVAKITNRLKKEFKAVLWSSFRREIPLKQIGNLLEYTVQGDYDPAVKKEYMEKSLPTIREVIKS